MKALAGFLLIPLLLTAQSQSNSCRGHKANTTAATTNVNHASPTPPSSPSPANANHAPQADGKTTPDADAAKPTEADANHTMSEETNASSNSSPRIARGTWGGTHIRMEVRADGADIEYDCAHGTINAPLNTDAAGRFSLEGTHTREGPGPIRVGKLPTSFRARYAGSVREKEMTLTVTLADSSQSVGTFTLRHGSEGFIRKCR